MSTSGNLPAGQFTTQINGKQCTAIPRSDAQSSVEAETAIPESVAAATTASSTSVAAAATVTEGSSILDDGFRPNTSQSTPSTSTTAAAVSIASTTQASTSSTSTPIVESTSVSATIVEASTSELPLLLPSTTSTTSSSSSISTPSATPASKGTTPTRSSSTSIPIAQSEIRTSSTLLTLTSNQSALPTIIASHTSTSSSRAITAPAQQESSAASGISSNPKLEAGPVVGGVIGSIALIALVGMIVFFCRRRRRRRDSLLTPLTGTEGKGFHQVDRDSLGPTKRIEKWRATVGYQTSKLRGVAATVKTGFLGIGSSLRSKVVGERSDTPSVNLNRGNSQFLDGPVPQHSRNNSVLSNTAHVAARDRFGDWWDRLKDNIIFRWRLRRQPKEPADPFAAARSMTAKQANLNGQPDFSQLLGGDDRQTQLQNERRRASLAKSIPNLGSLGLDFESHDPFADPIVGATSKNQNTAWAPPNPGTNSKTNVDPFADPIFQPQPSFAKSQTYISDIRRSRGQSVDTTENVSFAYNANNTTYRPPSTAVVSRYPSSIAPSRDSYRDTVISVLSTNARKGKGRSDPFDLERPELWQPRNPPLPNNNRQSSRPRGNNNAIRDSADMYPNPLVASPLRISTSPGNASGQTGPITPQPRVVSSTMSKYSSGVSSLGDWGDPGPDLGSGSSNTSLGGNTSRKGSEEFIFGTSYASTIKESPAKLQNGSDRWDTRRTDVVSPVSLVSNASSRAGVGKAM